MAVLTCCPDCGQAQIAVFAPDSPTRLLCRRCLRSFPTNWEQSWPALDEDQYALATTIADCTDEPRIRQPAAVVRINELPSTLQESRPALGSRDDSHRTHRVSQRPPSPRARSSETPLPGDRCPDDAPRPCDRAERSLMGKGAQNPTAEDAPGRTETTGGADHASASPSPPFGRASYRVAPPEQKRGDTATSATMATAHSTTAAADSRQERCIRVEDSADGSSGLRSAPRPYVRRRPSDLPGRRRMWNTLALASVTAMTSWLVISHLHLPRTGLLTSSGLGLILAVMALRVTPTTGIRFLAGLSLAAAASTQFILSLVG